MRAQIDNTPAVETPDSVNWEPPRLLGNDGQSAPVLGPVWRCRLGFSRYTSALFHWWFEAWDGELHDITIPHPRTGIWTVFSCYIETISPRMSTVDMSKERAQVSGLDVVLSKIVVN